jgi:phytoene dehydrogenase-like protein
VSTDSYDAVVLGGGHNGLVAAAYLARAGRTVLVLERCEALGGAAVSEQVFPGVGARLSRYSYLVSLLPRLIVDELGLDFRLVRRRVSSYTPDPRTGCSRGLLVDHDDIEATRASFAAVTGSQEAWPGWLELQALLARAARRLFPTLVEPLRSRAQLRSLLDDEQAWEVLFERACRRDAAERAFAGTFHVNEGAGQLQRAFERASAGAIPDPVPCELYCHSLTDPSILEPSLRAAGVHTLTVFALHMPARLFRGDPEGTRAAALRALLRSLDDVLAEPIADCLLRGPAGEPCIEARSPLDIEAELAMPGGHIFHRDLQWPFAEQDSEVGRWGVETEHPRVLLCGAGARRGGGVSGIPGRNAAMAVLEQGVR